MLVIVGLLLIFGLVIRCKWTNGGASRKDEILRLVAVASQDEAQVTKVQLVEDYSSPPQLMPQLENEYKCAVCHCPTTTRCSRCKAVRYCSGKCQIIHWRQGHKNDCKPAMSLRASKGSECVAETIPENQFRMHSIDEAEVCFDSNHDLDDSASTSSSTSCLFSPSERSETSFRASVSSFGESGTPIRPDKSSSSDVDSHASSSFSPVNPINQSHFARKGEYTLTTNKDKISNSSIKDRRKGDGSTFSEELHHGTVEPRNSESSRSVRTSSAEDRKNVAQTSTCKVPRSTHHKERNVELSSECAHSLKKSPSDESWVHESQFSNELQSTGKGLKTSVRRFIQHFRTPKQLKSQPLDMLKDYGGDHNVKVIFPLQLFMQLYSCDDVELHPFGLVNCGNSCYANAVMQCLIFTWPIASYLLGGLHSKTCWKSGWCFICKFERLVQKGQETNSPLSPVELLSQIQPIGREEDAHEFLRNVVDKMQSICLEKAGVSGPLAEDSTFIGLTFGGYLRSKIKCMKCLGRSEQCDRMMDLNVEINGNIYSLEEALGQFTISETLGGDDKYKCSRCKSYEKATKELSVLEAPNILTIVLKRFQVGNLGKLNKLVQFPEVLNLSPYMSGNKDKCPMYNLYAVVVHLGLNDANSGHYVSYVKDFRGNWYRVDDSRVSRVDLQTVLSVEAYILFYSRHSPRVGSHIRNSSTDSNGKSKANVEAMSSNNSKKRHSKTKSNSSFPDTGLMMHQKFDKHPYWMSPNDFIGAPFVDPEGWGFHSKNRNRMFDSLSDNSSVFSASDAGSYSTDSTKDSSVEDIPGYIFGSSWIPP